MRRTAPLIAVAALFSTGATAQVREPQKPEIAIDNVAGNVFVSKGTFTQAALSIGDDGVFLVDGVFSDAVEENGPVLRRLTDKPLRFVVNTHCHSDHTSANAAYEGTALIVAHPNVRKRLSTGTVVCPKAALPDITIDGQLSVYFNDEEIRILSLPAGHTDSDLVVFFTKSNVVHMGDVFIAPAVSFVDTSNGGTILGLIEELEYVLPLIPEDAKVIGGHGVVSSRADVARGLEVLNEMRAVVEAGVSAGKSMEQIVAESRFDQWKTLTAPGVPIEAYIDFLHKELTAR